ncbi:hypothetical protein C1X21_12525 [Pseudomonas sp. FW305-3-2-15-A-LB2]|nr:hypothetical protein C1X17_05910 [Pseudomonas sp. FW305-3-2-15-C-TSA2]PMV28973.1 hypothetical protein C1X22_12410 [Pseudomonas sp. DP16D-L5]PMV38968.1 hypothetical protein C1X21_12525 [Pseudomonas sp. FW305-3-2-15-A-LB2]PMV41003.1 hypothetical protein C1X16_25180 [Pseudomonas sp. FW305-3-2-15-C-R2A1]PMV49956.1 hypothetical protein C1X19_27195 [Pseudomonas sp. GW460-4]PMV51280.1 hypothetical protein C1X18_13375 [Pseudomonas sp. FW305-3-2-15-C-LB1]PMV63664.1 hypothetical protein C1X20_10065 
MVHQAQGARPPTEIERITREDGWGDGQEVRVYFCLSRGEASKACEERYVGMSYQQYSKGWKLIAATGVTIP